MFFFLFILYEDSFTVSDFKKNNFFLFGYGDIGQGCK